jgi:predicted acylesterase/phospholipase RssA
LAGQPLKIQVAFQGGGAKIFALIAAAEVLKGFEREGRVQVTRIAGTSAGALVGTLYAAGVEPAVMRSELGSFPLRKLMFRRLLPAPIHMLRKAWRNKPIAKVAPLEELLARLLRSGLDTKELVFNSLAIPTVVVATDVGLRRKRLYKEEDPLIPAILSSCAIPFFFRTASPENTDSLILDGGLWANLPSDELEQSAALGPIVAFTFLDSGEAKAPKSSFQLAKALLDTAIESSVLRARNRTGLHVVQLNPFGISTFDFEAAQRELAVPPGRPYAVGPAYDRARKATQERLEDLIEESSREPQVVLSNIWKEADARMMERLYRVYKSQEMIRPFKYLRHLVIIQADSLLSTAGDRKAHDVLTQILRFTPSSTEIDFILLSLSVADKEEIGFVSCSVTDAAGQKVPFEFFPVMSDGGPGLLVAFTPPLKKGVGDFQLRVRYKIRDSMPFLKKGERDEIVLTAERADGVVDRMELVLLVPEAFGKVRIEAPPAAERGVYVGGPWDLDELAGAMAPEGFVPRGWAGEEVPASAAFKAYFLKDA